MSSRARLKASTLLSVAILTAILAGCDRMPAPGEWNSYAEKKAHERFQELCKTQAIERIYRTVDNVDGYRVVSPWPPLLSNGTRGGMWEPEHQRQTSDQYGLADPYDYHLIGMYSPGTSLTTFYRQQYLYVEVTYPDGRTLRYLPPPPDKPFSVPAPTEESQPKSRYVVTFTDIGDKSTRDLWIGGGHLKITDSQTGELLAERIGFARGLLWGDHLAGPWSKAAFCTGTFEGYPSALITKVLNTPPETLPEGAPR